MTLKTRLIISLTVLTAIIVVLIGAGVATLGVVHQQTGNLLSAHIEPMRDLKIAVDAYAVAIVDNVHKTRSGAVGWDEAAQVLHKARQDIDAAWDRLQQRTFDEVEQPYIDAIVATKQVADAEIVVLDDLIARRDAAGLERFAVERLYPAIDPVSTAVSAHVDHLAEAAVHDIEEQAALQDFMRAAMGLAAVVALGAIFYGSYVILRSVASRIEATAVALSALASGDLGHAIPFVERGDEIGRMAAAAEVFRLNGLRLAELTEEEKAQQLHREAERRAMMAQLQQAFGSVIAAARAGDLDRRVEVQFDDPELTALADEVNQLLDTVSSGLSASADVLSALARAELDRRVEGRFEGAFGKLQRDTNAVADRLVAIVSDLRTTSGDLRTATGEILSGSNDLAERTTRQAATIEQTAATMSQFAASITATARRAEAAAEEVGQAASNATASGTSMQEAQQAMERISASSQRIFNIIGMIDDIAFQTNLLALNASVEAARAGTAGSGFAVVAQEVRRLAQSAAESSAEVKGLVEQSAREVSTGRQMVATAATGLEHVLGAVQHSAQAMLAIAGASQQQAREIAEVSTAVRQLDEMTQHNAALVEETNAAINQTEGQAARLEALIDVFRLEPAAPAMGRRAAA